MCTAETLGKEGHRVYFTERERLDLPLNAVGFEFESLSVEVLGDQNEIAVVLAGELCPFIIEACVVDGKEGKLAIRPAQGN